VITVDQKNKFHKFNLSTSSKEYQDVEAEFRKTAPNQIVSIERIQNREIYRLYNVKRQAMVNKYGSNLSGKELMLFHGTSAENIENIHAKGLNRSYAGGHGKLLYSDICYSFCYRLLLT
jgi:poly [ADP-ribose] polymerase 10/14/15